MVMDGMGESWDTQQNVLVEEDEADFRVSLGFLAINSWNVVAAKWIPFSLMDAGIFRWWQV